VIDELADLYFLGATEINVILDETPKMKH